MNEIIEPTAEELEALDALAQRSTEAQTETPEKKKYQIDGEEYDEDTLKGLVSKGKDYTHKTMELGDQRREYEATLNSDEYKNFKSYQAEWQAGGDRAAGLVESLAKQLGLSVAKAKQVAKETFQEAGDDLLSTEGLDLDDPQVAKLHKIATLALKRAEHSDQQLKDVTGVLTEIRGHIAQTSEEKKLESDIAAAHETLHVELKLKNPIPIKDLWEAVRVTKIKDPETAWIKHNKAKLADAYSGGKQGPETTDKPHSPSNSAKTFDPYSPDLDADDIARLYAQGYTPTRTSR